MKILIITDAWYPQVNGVVRTYEHLSAELNRTGHEVEVIGPADFAVSMAMPGYKEIRLAINPGGRLKRLIRNFAPEHIHIATEGPLGWTARQYCLKNNHKFSTTYHTHFPDYIAKRVGKLLPFLKNWVRNTAIKVLRKFHSASSTLFVATQSLEDELKSWDFKTPMTRLLRGVHLDRFFPGEKTAFKDLKKPVALYVGRVAIEKNLDHFLSMDWPGSKVIVGDGPSFTALQKKYPDAHFAGVKEGEELAAHYRSADLFVFPSRTDTFGIVLIEALASGLPVAGYNVTGPKDIITEDFLGALHKDDLAIAAKEALNSGDPAKRAKHVKTHYTWENTAKQFLSAIENIHKSA